MQEVIDLLKEAENFLKTEAFMECCAAERCEECVTQALAKLREVPESGEFTKIQRKAAQLAIDAYEEDEEWCPTKIARLLRACDIIDQLQAEKVAWEKQKCGKGFTGEGVTCDDRHANIGHYVTHYRRAKQIFTKQYGKIKQLQAENKTLKQSCKTHQEYARQRLDRIHDLERLEFENAKLIAGQQAKLIAGS